MLWLCLISTLGLVAWRYGWVLRDIESRDPVALQLPAAMPPYQGISGYFINLDRSVGRLHHITTLTNQITQLADITFTRIAAVDGLNFTESDLTELVHADFVKFAGKYPSRGTIACSMSHIKAWQAFLDSKAEFAIIFEDDIGVDPAAFAAMAQAVVRQPQYWDICSFEVIKPGTPLALTQLEGTDKQLCVYLTNIYCAGAYILNRSAAAQLLRKALPIKLPVDLYYSRGWELGGLKFTGIEPRIVDQAYGDSDIQEAGRYQRKNFWHRVVTRQLFRVGTFLMRSSYNLSVYLRFLLGHK